MSARLQAPECRPPLNERKRRQTSARIVEAAVRLFEERGFDHTTADDIADAAECSRSTLFRYFGTKEDILFGDVYEQLALVRAELMALPKVDDPWRCAKEVGLRRLIESITGENGPPRQAIELWSTHPALVRTYLHINYQWEQVMAGFFAAQRGTDPTTDLASQLRANVAVSAVRAVLLAYSVPGTDFQAALDEAFAQVEAGFG
jgi:AcrR family transcriptional regulator